MDNGEKKLEWSAGELLRTLRDDYNRHAEQMAGLEFSAGTRFERSTMRWERGNLAAREEYFWKVAKAAGVRARMAARKTRFGAPETGRMLEYRAIELDEADMAALEEGERRTDGAARQGAA